MLPSLGKEFDASASTGEAAAVDDFHRTRWCCTRNNIPGLADSFRGIRGGIWRDMAGYGGIWRDMAGYGGIPGDTRGYDEIRSPHA